MLYVFFVVECVKICLGLVMDLVELVFRIY